MSHSLFAPSKAHMWMACPGSMAFPENQEQGESSTYADDGTASHEWSALCLKSGKDAALFIGSVKEINGRVYAMDEERAAFCQIYIDDVRRRAISRSLYVEYSVDLSHILGPEQGGTADAAIYCPETKQIIVEDLKYGTGEKIFSFDDVQAIGSGEALKTLNPQLALYLLGMCRDVELLGGEVETVTGVICQPRLGHICETTITFEELVRFSVRATGAQIVATSAILTALPSVAPKPLNPGQKQCRWCRAAARCPALTAKVQEETRSDFDDMTQPTVPADIARAYAVVPLIELWCKAVKAETWKQVAEGAEVIGPDGKPYKFVEGKEGNRAWVDEGAALAALMGQLPREKIYIEKMITAPQAAKILDKKATKQLWADLFAPMIKRARSQPILVPGSDERPAVSSAGVADDFEEDLSC